MTSYTAQLSGAWHAWVLHARPRHLDLRVIFAALAGLAPLGAERLASRVPGAPVRAALQDEAIFYDTSSYGSRALTAMAGFVRPQALVYGSDWPYVRTLTLGGARPAEFTRHARALLGADVERADVERVAR